ncbi:acetyltransferase [Vibrio cholerae]|nr:acetyltransferase [Vibrio cholerae]
MVAVVVFEFSGMRCQPLRRALGFYEENNEPSVLLTKKW